MTYRRSTLILFRSYFLGYCCLALLMGHTSRLMAQVLNGNSFNYQVLTDQVCWAGNNDDFSAEDPTFFYSGTHVATNESKDQCVTPSNGGCHPSNMELIHQSNTNDTRFKVKVRGFEDDGGERCSEDGGDLHFLLKEEARTAHLAPTGQWNIRDFDIITSTKAKYKYAWRHTNGDTKDVGRALNFGIIPPNEGPVFSGKRHRNATSKPVGSASDIAYSNSWSGGEFQDAPDVFYIFEIEHSMEVLIETDETAFQHWLYLMQLPGQDLKTKALSLSGDGTDIRMALCEGKYGIVVEGHGGRTGKFRLSVSGKEIAVDPGRIAINGSSRQCENGELAPIGSVSPGSSQISNETIAYSWEQNTIDPNDETKWGVVPGAGNTLQLDSPGRMGSSDIWFRRKASDCSSSSVSNFVKYTNTPFNGAGGQISLSNSDPIPAGSDAGKIISIQPASAGHDHSILWRKRTVENDVPGAWSEPFAGGQTLSIGLLDITTEFERIVQSNCTDEQVFSNSVTKVVIPIDGIIEGRVLSRLGAPIRNVTITATLQNTVLGTPQSEYQVTTDADGKYRISNIYYGAGEAQLKVEPSRENHEFTSVSNASNSFTNVTLSSPIPGDPRNIASNVDFTDITVLTIKGKVEQSFEGTSCRLGGVTIQLERNGGVVNTTTTYTSGDTLGEYEITVNEGVDEYTIRPLFMEHEFAETQRTLFIEDDLTDIDFEDVQQQTLRGTVLAGCGVFMGKSRLNISALEGSCAITTHVETDDSGRFSIDLPARQYLVRFDDMVGEPVAGFDKLDIRSFLNTADTVDLRADHDTLDLVYHQTPVIEVAGMPDGPECYEFSILEQGYTYPLMIKAYEGTIGGCPIDTGFLEINDQIGDMGSIDQAFKLDNPASDQIDYQLIAGLPRQTAPHLKNLRMALTAVFGSRTRTTREEDIFTTDALVTGAIPQGTGVLTVSPQLPLFILRDPPGDLSFSYLEETTVLETATSFYTQKGRGSNAWTNVRLGTEFTTGLGFSTETEIWADLGTAFTTTEQNLSSEESIVTMTTSRRFSTADDSDIIGEKGDLIIAAAMNLVYATTVEVLFNETTCQPFTAKDWMIDNQGFSTGFVYSTQYIRTDLMKTLRDASAQSEDPKEKERFKNQISVWEQVLAYNEELKERADFVQNETWDGTAGPEEFSTILATSETLTIEFTQEIDEEAALEAGINIAGSGASGGAVINMRMETGQSNSETNLTELTTGFVLDDDDVGDAFSVDIKRDPVYKTPVFELVGGQTSCPYEEGSRARDGVEMFSDDPIQVDVNPADAAEFFLLVSNTSTTEETRDFLLKAPGFATNPFGAEITIGGQDPPYLIEDLDFGQTATVLVKVRQGASSVFTYSGMTFEVESACDADINATVDLSAYFVSPCSSISLDTPTPDWLVNQSNDNQIIVGMSGYDLDQLNQVIIEYARAGTNGWITAKVLASDGPDLGASPLGAEVEIDISGIPDGIYDIRLRLACDNGTVFSEKVRGRIDRTAPTVFGLPRPVDDIYDLGDEISVQFNEPLDCALFDPAGVSIISEVGGINVPLTAECSGESILITPNDPTSDILDHPGLPFQVSISGLQDLYGNMISQPIEWNFAGGGEPASFDADGDGVTDDVDICPGFNDNLDADSDGVPDGCDLCPNVANAGLSFDGTNDYVDVPVGGFNANQGTLSFWFKTNDPEARQIPVYLGNQATENGFGTAANAFEFHAAISNGRALVIFQNGELGEVIRLRTLSTILPNQWYHLAVTYDVTGDIRLYLNGTLEDDDFMSDYFLGDLMPTYFRLGRPGAGTNQFQGELDEVRLWDVFRSDLDIKSSFNTEVPFDTEGLLTYYSFNNATPNADNTGITTVIDQSGNGNDGTLKNFARTGDRSNWVFGSPVRHLDSNDNGIGDVCEGPEPSPLREALAAKLEPQVNAVVPSDAPRITRLFPVPAREQVLLNYVLPRPGSVDLQVFDLRGQPVIRRLLGGEKGTNRVSVNVLDLPAGTYFLRLGQSDGTYDIKRIIVQ